MQNWIENYNSGEEESEEEFSYDSDDSEAIERK
jgi:hypothetical protein